MSENTGFCDNEGIETLGINADQGDSSPDLEPPRTNATRKRGRKLPEVLTYEEIDRFLLSVDDLEDLAAVRIMLYAGLRVEEACSLFPMDVSLENRAVFVREGKGGKDRWAPLDIGTLSLSNCLVRVRNDELPGPLYSRGARTLQRHVKEITRRANIAKDVTPHTLRHTCATWQLDKGLDIEVVKNNLGHSDVSVTQIYLHLNIRQRSRLYTDATRFEL